MRVNHKITVENEFEEDFDDFDDGFVADTIYKYNQSQNVNFRPTSAPLPPSEHVPIKELSRSAKIRIIEEIGEFKYNEIYEYFKTINWETIKNEEIFKKFPDTSHDVIQTIESHVFNDLSCSM